MRAVSTVLDVALFLLLVGAAITAVTAPVPGMEPTHSQHAANTAGILTTSTATVSYALVPPPGTTSGGNPEFDRYAHGTLARLLATGTLGGLAIEGTQVSQTRAAYRTAVAEATRETIETAGHTVQVRAVWVPFRGASIEGRQVVGTAPTERTAVESATVRVPSGLPAVSQQARTAAREDGYAGVARVVATAVVSGLFPPNTTRLALAGDHPVDALVRYRYRRVGQLLGVSVTDVGPSAVEHLNDRLTRRLTQRFERELRSSFDTPERAAQSVSVGTVRITVRVGAT